MIFITLSSLIQSNPDVAMDSIVHITQHLTSGQRSEMARILETMETSPGSSPSQSWLPQDGQIVTVTPQPEDQTVTPTNVATWNSMGYGSQLLY